MICELSTQLIFFVRQADMFSFDGFGSYPEHMQFSNMFKNIGRIGIEMYLLFQHHTTLDILRNVSTDHDLFTITGTGWHFVKYLGPAVVLVGLDCRSERNQHQVLAGPTYQGIFPKIAMLPPTVQHCLWMISIPLIYPRLETAEHIAQTFTTGKRAVTGAYNVLGKVTSSVAGVVGAKDVVGSGFDSVKRAVGKSGLMGGILSPFGEFDLLDELRDQWTHESKVRKCPRRPIHTRRQQLTKHEITGLRANLPNSHPPRNSTPEIPPNDLPLRCSQCLRRWPRPRPGAPLRPQNNVPAHILFRCKQPSTFIYHQNAALKQQAPLRPSKRPPLHPFPALRHERGHDGDLSE